MKKRFISILLCLCMVFMLFPVTALAEGETPEQVTEIVIYDLTIPIVGEHPNYPSWMYSSTPSRSINVGLQWYQISKEAYPGAADDDWQLINSGYLYSSDYYYKAVFSVRVSTNPEKNYIIPDNVNATINGKECDIQIAEDGKSCVMSYIFEAKAPQQVNTINNIAVTVDDPVIGAKPDFEPEFTATPAGSVTLDECCWYKISVDDYTGTDGDSWDEISANDVFEEGYYYAIDLFFTPNENYSLSKDMTATVKGKPHDDTYGPVYGENYPGKSYAYVCGVFGPLVPQDAVTLTVPFTTTVELGGSTAPGKTVFELELVDNRGEKLIFDGVEVSASVTTNGAGKYEGEMTLTGSSSQQVLDIFANGGVFVQQVNAGEPNWTYDDTVWGLYLRNIAELAADDAAAGYSVLIFPTGFEEDGDGGRYYYLDFDKDPVERMSFTNTYTYSAPTHNTTTIVISGDNKPAEQNPNTGAPVAANMSTLSVLTIAAAAAAVLKMKKH